MPHDLNELVKDALESGAQFAAIVDTSKIDYREEFRQACEKNVCGKYNTNWMGPPALGPISELKIKAAKFKQGLLFQTVYQMKSSFDLDGMEAAAGIHRATFRRILALVNTKYQFRELLPLDAGCCSVCARCTYLDGEPCRHPDLAVASLEAYGIDVMALEKENGLPYYSGANTVSYVGLILFDED